MQFKVFDKSVEINIGANIHERFNKKERLIIKIGLTETLVICIIYLFLYKEGWPSGQWQQTVNLPTEVYESSNLSPSTISGVNNCNFEFVVYVMWI